MNMILRSKVGGLGAAAEALVGRVWLIAFRPISRLVPQTMHDR